jgi:hypothetical protein
MSLIKSILNRVATCAVAAAALVGTTGCTATVTARTPARATVIYDYPVTYVETAPVRIYERPRVYYHGRPAYLVGQRWYYPSDGGWVYFREEPRELRRARVQRSFVRVERDERDRRRYAEPREKRRRYVDQPRETRRRRGD